MTEHIYIQWANGKFLIDKKRLASLSKSQEDLVNLLSSSPLLWKYITKDLSEAWLNALIKIGKIGELDIWIDAKNKFYNITIKGLEDCANGFIGVHVPIVWNGGTLSESIVNLKEKIEHSGEMIVKDLNSGEGYRNIYYDDTNEQFYKWNYIVYPERYRGLLVDEDAFWDLWWKPMYKDIVIEKNSEWAYFAWSNVIFWWDGLKIKIQWNSAISAWNNFISFLKKKSARYYQNWKIKEYYWFNKELNSFFLI